MWIIELELGGLNLQGQSCIENARSDSQETSNQPVAGSSTCEPVGEFLSRVKPLKSHQNCHNILRASCHEITFVAAIEHVSSTIEKEIKSVGRERRQFLDLI